MIRNPEKRLVLLPGTIRKNGEERPFTLNLVSELAAHPQDSSRITSVNIDNEVEAKYGNQPSDGPRWYLATEDVIDKSRNERLTVQEGLEPPGYEVPKILLMSWFIIASYGCEGKVLFGCSPLTYTSCQEDIEGFRCVVGGFAPSSVLHADYGYFFGWEFIGVAAVRPF